MSRGAMVAERLLNDLQIADPKDLALLDKIAWARKALVREAPISGSEARLNYDPVGRSIITVSSNIDSFGRKRFSIAHELGHLELHARSKLLYLCSREDIQYGSNKVSLTIEDEANEFASHFLLPRRFILERFSNTDPSFDMVVSVASEFNVSLTATALRLLDFTEEPLAVVYSRNGFIEWFQATQDFSDSGAFVDIRTKVRKPSGAAYFFNDNVTPLNRWRTVPADSWLKEGRFGEDAKIKEWSIGMPNYDSVLTILWLTDDFEDNDYY